MGNYRHRGMLKGDRLYKGCYKARTKVEIIRNKNGMLCECIFCCGTSENVCQDCLAHIRNINKWKEEIEKC